MTRTLGALQVPARAVRNSGVNPQSGHLRGFYRMSPSQQRPGEVGPGVFGEGRELCAAGPRPRSVGQSPGPESRARGAAPQYAAPRVQKAATLGDGPCPLSTLSTRARCSQPGPAGPLTSAYSGGTDDPDGAQPRLWGWRDTQGSRCPCQLFRLSAELFATGRSTRTGRADVSQGGL